MPEEHQNIRLSSSEVAVLWGTYINDTLGICAITYFLEHVEDSEIRSILEYALDLSKKHIDILRELFAKEDFPLPVGFTEQDVNPKAAKLFSDSFILYYIQNMGAMGINSYSVSLPNSARMDIRDFFTSCLGSSSELFNRASNLLQERGLFIRSPILPYPEKTEFIHKKHFLSGWLGDQRPLTTTEISFLFFNLYRNTLGSAMLMGFSQVAESKAVRRYLVRGSEIANHHCTVFSKFLTESNIMSPMTWDISPLLTKEAPFSDKLMMFHTAALNNAGVGYYGSSMGGSARKDLSVAYARLSIEVSEFAADGARLMIDNGWLEKPPSAPDRKKLARG
ncbi:DUF3231 family protein [Fredinandcohnia sp. 179-A 10B2 NHS]|uniref:DUF3231 family protein n=1 Tax=Fredinandcohnia sp. 179-A 10B2 NHS TaxID=3235176 RepID=UPI0039A3D1E6